MSVDVASFDEFDTVGEIESVQRGLIEVFLEGPDDVSLFSDFWFLNYLDRLAFRRPAQAGGCEAVIAAVESARDRNQVPTYGIVDRDIWRRRKDVRTFLEPDDERFLARAIGRGIYVTLYWEVEAYLLHPEMLCIWIGTAWPRAPAKPCSPPEMTDKLAAFCECLLEVTGLNMLLHHLDKPEKPRFGFSVEDVAHMRHLVSKQMDRLSRDPGTETVKLELKELLDGVRAFGNGLRGTAKLEFLLRFVDSKALIAKLASSFGVDDGRIWSLAQHMKSYEQRPRELQRVLDAIVAEQATGRRTADPSRSV